jgi:putative endonuclease
MMAPLDEQGDEEYREGIGLMQGGVLGGAYTHPSWPGLSRPSTSCSDATMKGGWVYFMTNQRDGTLYAGVTSALPKRAYEHREGLVDGFTKEHGLKRLVYYEWHDTIQSAIQREKNIKH